MSWHRPWTPFGRAISAESWACWPACGRAWLLLSWVTGAPPGADRVGAGGVGKRADVEGMAVVQARTAGLLRGPEGLLAGPAAACALGHLLHTGGVGVGAGAGG